MFKLSDAAAAANVNPRTLSDWLDRRLIENVACGSGRHRQFTQDDIVKIALTSELTRLGVTVAEAAKAAATYADDAGADRDASDPFPNGRTLLVVDQDGPRCINVTASREDFQGAMATVYGDARSVVVVNVGAVIQNVERALADGASAHRPAGAVYRHGRELHR